MEERMEEGYVRSKFSVYWRTSKDANNEKH